MYSKKQVMKALRLYRKCGSATETIRTLGYPSRTRLYQWARNGEWKDPRACPESPPLAQMPFIGGSEGKCGKTLLL